ncbi:MAG: hypothetical protein ABIT08_15570 [Bacteroidia bacterium]
MQFPFLVCYKMISSESKSISDQTILSMIAENNLEAWGHLYDKYAPAMFGIICTLTDDRTLAEEIFKETFLQLKEKQILSKVTYALCPCLLRHTHIFARQQLKARGIACSNSPVEQTSLINILCSQDINFKQAASIFNLTEEEAKKKLRAEFLELRSQSKEEKPTQHQQEFKQEYSYNFNSNNQI